MIYFHFNRVYNEEFPIPLGFLFKVKIFKSQKSREKFPKSTQKLKSETQSQNYSVELKVRKNSINRSAQLVGSPINSAIHHLELSSMSCISLKHLPVFDYWETWYCFEKLPGNTPTTLFHRQFDLFLQGVSH